VTLGAASVPLIVLNALASSIWVGGLVAIFIVARVASATLEPAQRVAFFRALGRSYGIVGSAALVVSLASGAAMLGDHAWDGLLLASALVAAALLAATATGMAQARAMTRLRRRLVGGGGGELEARVRSGAKLAAALRGTIALLTLALVVLGSALAGQ
jgi:uncharacterized membrane protein